jgi:hypothetical protein
LNGVDGGRGVAGNPQPLQFGAHAPASFRRARPIGLCRTVSSRAA